MPKRKSNETLVDILPHYRRVTIVSIDSCNWLQDVIVEAVNQVIQVRLNQMTRTVAAAVVELP